MEARRIRAEATKGGELARAQESVARREAGLLRTAARRAGVVARGDHDVRIAAADQRADLAARRARVADARVRAADDEAAQLLQRGLRGLRYDERLSSAASRASRALSDTYFTRRLNWADAQIGGQKWAANGVGALGKRLGGVLLRKPPGVDLSNLAADPARTAKNAVRTGLSQDWLGESLVVRLNRLGSRQPINPQVTRLREFTPAAAASPKAFDPATGRPLAEDHLVPRALNPRTGQTYTLNPAMKDLGGARGFVKESLLRRPLSKLTGFAALLSSGWAVKEDMDRGDSFGVAAAKEGSSFAFSSAAGATAESVVGRLIPGRDPEVLKDAMQQLGNRIGTRLNVIRGATEAPGAEAGLAGEAGAESAGTVGMDAATGGAEVVGVGAEAAAGGAEAAAGGAAVAGGAEAAVGGAAVAGGAEAAAAGGAAAGAALTGGSVALAATGVGAAVVAGAATAVWAGHAWDASGAGDKIAHGDVGGAVIGTGKEMGEEAGRAISSGVDAVFG